MKTLFRSFVCAGLLAMTLAVGAADKPSGAGVIDFGKFVPSASGEFVEVHVTSNLIAMVAKLAKAHEPQIAEVLSGLKLVRVNVIGLGDDNRAETERQVRAIRTKLDAAGWEHVVTAQKKDEDVSIFMKMKGEEAVEGIVVTVIQRNKEAVLINIVGDIRPEKLSLVGERFNIDPLKKLGGNFARK